MGIKLVRHKDGKSPQLIIEDMDIVFHEKEQREIGIEILYPTEDSIVRNIAFHRADEIITYSPYVVSSQSYAYSSKWKAIWAILRYKFKWREGDLQW